MQRRIAPHDTRQYFLSGLNQSLGPASLLSFERSHFDRQFGGAFHILQVNKLPSLKLRAIGEIGVFGEGIVLPAPRFFNGPPPPNSGRAVEVKKNAAASASG